MTLTYRKIAARHFEILHEGVAVGEVWKCIKGWGARSYINARTCHDLTRNDAALTAVAR